MKCNRIKCIASITLVLFFLIVNTTNGYAQKSKKKGKTEKSIEKKKDKKDDSKPIKEVIEKCREIEGLFTLYQDTTTGSSYLLIKKEQIGREFIYFSVILDGVDRGQFRGNYKGAKIFSIQKYFNKIEFTEENTGFYFDSTHALSKAKDANINKPILISEKIMGIDENNTQFLIHADKLFLTENFEQVKPTPNPKENNTLLGKLNEGKSKYLSLKNYPLNTDVVVEYVYENPYPAKSGNSEVTDSRYISVKFQHGLIEMPKNNFQPRFDDPRIGFFANKITDMTTASATPYKDVINRWHLEKKDKTTPLSEPVQPIVWWIENTTPLEFRDAVKEGILAWNKAFEAAGFKNSMEVKIQPDDASWDAGDIRYNVVRWTSSPSPLFGGYGPSFTNPRTGQILGSDVMLEYIYVTNRVKQEKLFVSNAMNDMETTNQFNEYSCFFNEYMQQNQLFGQYVMGANGFSELEITEMIKQALYNLTMHEIGHTLGLCHNMKASQFLSPVEINNKQLTSEVGLIGSVMDYTPTNFALEKGKQGEYFATTPGPYDKWVIEYGYSEAENNPEAETQRLQNILSRSTSPELAFGNDADDMRNPGHGIDPRVMVGDMSSDAITYALERLLLINKTFPQLKDKFTREGQSFHELKNAYGILEKEYNTAIRVVSRYIGGVYVDRAFGGQISATLPFTPVSYDEQKRAMKILSKYAFGTDAFKVPEELYHYLQTQRRGFDHYGKNEDPQIHEWTLTIQQDILNHLLHPNVLTRITDTKVYGNKYALSEFMEDVTNAIFKEDIGGDVNSFRQNLQAEYVKRLIKITEVATPGYDNMSQAMAMYHLNTIKRMLLTAPLPDTSTKAHRQYLLFTIEKALTIK